MAKFCTNCGNPLTGNEKFCTKCGHKLNASQTDAPPQVTTSVEATPAQSNLEPPMPDYSGEPSATSNSKKKYIYIAVAAVVIVIAAIGIGISVKSNAGGKETSGEELAVTEDSMKSALLSAVDETQTIEKESNQKAPHVYNDVNSLMRYVGSNPSAYSIRKMGKDWNWKSDGSEGDVPVVGEGYLGLSPVRIVAYISPKGYLYGRYYSGNGMQLDVNGYLDSNCELRIQLGHGNETSYMRLLEDADFDNVYTGAWGRGNKSVSFLFDYFSSDYSADPADFSNFDSGRLDGHGILPTDAPEPDIEIEEY